MFVLMFSCRLSSVALAYLFVGPFNRRETSRSFLLGTGCPGLRHAFPGMAPESPPLSFFHNLVRSRSGAILLRGRAAGVGGQCIP